MLIFQATKTRAGSAAFGSNSDFASILSDSNFQLQNHYILGEAINNFYLRIPVSERVRDVVPAQKLVSDDLFNPHSTLKTQLQNSDGEFTNSTVTALDLQMPVDGFQDVGFITRPSLAAYRKVLSGFVVDETGSKQLNKSLRIPMDLMLAFFSNALEGRVPSEQRRESLIEGSESAGAIGLRQKLREYFTSEDYDAQTATAQNIFDEVIRQFLLDRGFSDGSDGLDDKITPIQEGFFNQPKNIEQIIISATFDRVATSDLSSDAKISAYDRKCLANNTKLLEDIQYYTSSLFGKDLSERINPYLYYQIQKKDLDNADLLEKLDGEIEKHLHFIDEIFLSRSWLNSPQLYNDSTNSDFKNYYSEVLDVANSRGLNQDQLRESIKERYSELEHIREQFKSGDVLQAWRDFAIFRAKYATARYFEFDDNDKTSPEKFSKTTLHSDDFITSEDVASYLAVTASLNMLGRNVAIEPSPGKNLLSLNFLVPKDKCTTSISQVRDSEGVAQGVVVNSQAAWEVSVNPLTTIVVPDMEIIHARANDYLRLVNSNLDGARINSEFTEDGMGIIFTISSSQAYASIQDAQEHSITFNVPGSLREDEQNLTSVPIYTSKIRLETKEEKFVPQAKPEYFDASLSFGLMDYENLHQSQKEKTIANLYGDSNVAGESLRGDRKSSVAGLSYANTKLSFGIPTQEGLIAETWGQSKVVGWSGYWWASKFGEYSGDHSIKSLNEFFWDNASDALRQTIQEREEGSMEASGLFDKYKDENGQIPKVYESLESLMDYAGPTSYHRYVSDMYLTFLKDAYKKMPSGEKKDQLFEHIYQTYVDNLNFYPKHFLKNHRGLQFSLGSSMRLMEEMTKRMLESGPAIHLESTRLGIPFTNIGVSTNGMFYADLGYAIPAGKFNDQWERQTSFGPAVQVPGLAGSMVNFQNMDGFAATLGWKGLLWASKTDKSQLKGKVELGFFITLPSTKQTEQIQSLLDSAERMMGIWSQYDRKNENTLNKTSLRAELNNLKKFFSKTGPKYDPKALDLIEKVEYAMNNEWDDPSRTNLEGALYALANSDKYAPGHIHTYYSGEELGASFISYGTFINDLGRYQGVERFAQTLGAGYAKLELDFDSEVSTNMPYNVRLTMHPVVPFLIDDVATSLVSTRPIFEGEGDGQVITSKKVLESVMDEGKSYLSPKLPVTLIDTDIGYIYPFSANIASKVGLASSFNLFAFDMEKSDFYVDFKFSDWMNVRLKHGFEKTLKYSPYTPNVGASAQVFFSDNLAKVLGKESLAANLSFGMLWERDLPSYSLNKPHLESFGYSFMLSASFSDMFGHGESNKKVMEQRNVREADNVTPHGLQDWRAPKETFLQWRMQQQAPQQKNISLLSTLTPGEREDLEGRKVLMAKNESYYHPHTREVLSLDEAVSQIHKSRWENKLLSLLSDGERDQLSSRRSSVHAEPMYLNKEGTAYVTLDDAVFEIFDSSAKESAERGFVKFMSSD